MEKRIIKEKEQRKAAREFAAFWKDKGYEKGQSQAFWLSLLRDVFGVEHPEQVISFEDQIMMEHTSFIDGYISETKVLIEQKSIEKDLDKPIKQSDGSYLTPFQQAKRYSIELPYDDRPRWIVISNFKEFRIYDMNKPNGDPEIITLKSLPKEYYRLNFLVDTMDTELQKEMEISLMAGEIVGKLYDSLRTQYKNPNDPKTLKDLNILCVRLVFCLYAEDAALLGHRLMFYEYLKRHESDLRPALIRLFKMLDTKEEDRDPYEDEDLLAFPYVNGGLFSDENTVIPRLDKKSIELLKNASRNFDWSEISPTIFGAVFESTLNPETRRSGGMHYTSIENIDKVIRPLFLDDLEKEFDSIMAYKQLWLREEKLRAFQEKLSKLTWFDPACGSGNFLTQTFLSIRKLENKVIDQLYVHNDQEISTPVLNTGDIIKVSIDQFYGIEINDFAVTVAKTALWIAEHQMLVQTEELVKQEMDFLPLKTQANIHEGNALKIDWSDIIDADSLDYIIGNPPFVGARLMSPAQKNDLQSVFNRYWKGRNSLDYVSCWYKKANDLMPGRNIKAAFVSTNSIVQGDSVSIFWEPLMNAGLVINFAHQTFIWNSESTEKAHVHCVIIGFSHHTDGKKVLYSSNRALHVENINGYLLSGKNVFIHSRKEAICDVPPAIFGSMPNDGGNLSNFSKDKVDIITNKYPDAKNLFKLIVGATEFIQGKERWCLWLKGVDPELYINIPPVVNAITKTRQRRQASKRSATNKLAEYPYLFGEVRQPEIKYLLIPRSSSEKRRYIPMGFMSPDVICSDGNIMIPGADLYHFGVLESIVHMAWVRTVAGRLKSDYRYSNDIVYNNFPWPVLTEKQHQRIEETAQGILDARSLYSDSTLKSLYDDLTMPIELRKAHQANDKAVMEAYGFSPKMSESEIVEALFKLYEKLVQKEEEKK